MRPKLFLSFIGYGICIAVLFTSCVVGTGIADPYYVDLGRQQENQYYVKSSPNIPLLTEKNDISIAGGVSSGSQFTAGEFHGAYMPGKHIGVIGSYTRGDNKHYMKLSRFELGSGYVMKLSQNWHFETYAGLGHSKIENEHYTGYSTIKSTHYFIQPAITVSNPNKTVQFAFVSRLEGTNFNVTDAVFNTDRESFSDGNIRDLNAKPFHIMWQPGAVFRFGWQKFMFQGAYSYAADMSGPDIYGSKGSFLVGVLCRFNAGKKEKL